MTDSELEALLNARRADFIAAQPGVDRKHLVWAIRELFDHMVDRRAGRVVARMHDEIGLLEARLSGPEADREMCIAIRQAQRKMLFGTVCYLSDGTQIAWHGFRCLFEHVLELNDVAEEWSRKHGQPNPLKGLPMTESEAPVPADPVAAAAGLEAA